MKKALSFVMAMVLTISMIPIVSNTLVANAACTSGTTDLLEFGQYLIDAGSTSKWYDSVLVDNGETGTQYDPIIIDSAEEFVYLAKGIPNDTAGKYYKVADGISAFDLSKGDLSLNGTLAENIDRIKASGKNHLGGSPGFQGHFDGNGVTVYGAWTNHNEENIGMYAGLFSVTSGDVTIKNINVKFASFTAKNIAGGIVGYHVGDGNNSLTIENCSVTDSHIEVKASGWNVGIGGIVGSVKNLSSYTDTEDTDGDGDTTETIYVNGAVTIKNCFVNLDEDYFISSFEKGTQTDTTLRGIHGGVAGFMSTNALSVSDCVVIGITPYATTSCTINNDIQHSGLAHHFNNIYTDQPSGQVDIGGTSGVRDFSGRIFSLNQSQMQGAAALDNMNLDPTVWMVDDVGYPELRSAHKDTVFIKLCGDEHYEYCKCGFGGAKKQCTYTNGICTVCNEGSLEHQYDDEVDLVCNICEFERSSIEFGDVNEDKKINNKDYAALMRYLNGWSVTINIYACDLNRDEKTNNKDCAILMQYLNGWHNCLHKYSAVSCDTPKTCVDCGNKLGEAIGHNYVTGECSRCGVYSEDYCPKLYFTGDMSEITLESQRNKDIVCNIDVEYRSKEQIVNRSAKIKIQGSSSTQWRKKNYTITFYEENNFDKKQGIDVGWGSQNKYCLKANWIDKTHSRNVVTAKLAGEIQEKYGLLNTAPNNGAIDGFPVEVYINGEFHGLYTMNIPKDEWQFNMDKENPDHIVIGGGGWEDPVLFKEIPTDFGNENSWEVEVGPEDDATLAKLQRLVDFVLNSSDEDFKSKFSEYLNLDSTLNYYVMMNYAWMPDNVGKNMLLATYDGNVWYPSLYDLDTTWGAHWTGGYLYNYSSGVVNGSNSLLWQRFEKHFKPEIAARYFELRNSVLDTEYVMSKFHEFYGTIPQEILDRETAKWTRTDDPIPGFDLSQIQDYLDTVIPRLDARFSSWYIE